MRVLILRPRAQAEAMARGLAAHGIEALVAPMLEIRPAAGLGAQLKAMAPLAGLILTSANGVEALTADGPLGDLADLPLVAVGPGTLAAARRAGFRQAIEAGGDGAAVVATVAARFAPTAGRLVHIAGRDRAGDIVGALATQGFAVAVVEAYVADAIDGFTEDVAAALARDQVDAIVIASARTTAAFARCWDAAALGPSIRPVVVALSAAVATPILDRAPRIVIAERPDGESLTKAVLALRPRVENNAGVEEAADTSGVFLADTDGTA